MKSLINRHKRNKSKDKTKASTVNQADLNNLVDKEMTQNQSVIGSTNLLNKLSSPDEEEPNASTSKEPIEFDLINKMLPKELLIRIFSHLDTVSLCRCAQVSKYWNELALDGSNWQYIDLFNFQVDISESVLENIGKKCHEFLKGLRLENCRSLTDDAIKKLAGHCVNIEILNMKQCIKLTNSSFNEIGSCFNKLIYLNLESCCITDEGLIKIGKGCPDLVSIDVSYCKSVSSEALKKFVSYCKNLKFFSCKGALSVNDGVLQSLSKNCPNLLLLNLNRCQYILDEGMIAISNKCQSLTHINISNCSSLTDLTLQSIGRNCHNLVVFESPGCANFSDNGFMALARGCHKLEKVDLEECSRITDLTLQNFSLNCLKLRHLNLSRCECITDEGIRQLGTSSCVALNETLQVLELDNCPLITDASLEQLYTCHSLVQLELYDCQLLTKNGIKKLQSKLPNAKVHCYFAPSVVANQRPTRSCSCKCCILL